MLVAKENANDLIKSQMKTISLLQDKINLQEFDIIEQKKELRKIQEERKLRTNIIIKARKKLQEFKRKGIYDEKKINEILKGLQVKKDEED